MIALAFKYANLDDFLSRTIKERTGGQFSHVELWLSGEGKSAVCYSSRGNGTSLEVIDITDPKIWNVVPVQSFSPLKEDELLWFCKGSSGRAYDAIGLVGIGWDLPVVHDPYDRFCSEACFEALQSVGGLFLNIGPRWMVAPSGHPKGGFGLFEMIIDLNTHFGAKGN